MRVLLLLAAAVSLAGQSLRTPSCTEDKRSECWIEVANQPGCQFWLGDPTPSLRADWSGECSQGLAEGRGTVTWRSCFWDNGNCMPVKTEQSGSFLNGKRHGRWIEGPLDALGCHRWNTDLFFTNATLEEVTACLEAGADVNAKESGYLAGTPLHHAVRKNKVPIIELLLNAGADIDARDTSGDTPLHEACQGSKDPQVFRALLQAGADPNARDNDGSTPLHELAEYHDIPEATQAGLVVQILIDAGADVKARQSRGYTPLHFAADSVELPIIEALLKAGADVNARTDEGRTPLHEVVEDIRWGSYEGLDVVEELLAAGADPMARDERGRTPMRHGLNSGNLVLYRVLLEAGADPLATRDGWGREPMHHALFGGNSELYEILLEAGADVNARDNKGETPLHLAASLDMLGEIEFLLTAGADLEARDNEGNTPLHAVFESDVRIGLQEPPQRMDPISVEMEAVEVLIKAGANLEARDNEGNTPLHLAAKYIAEHNGIVRGFNVVTGAFHLDYSLDGPTPVRLHAGDAVRVLLAAGANPNAKNREGKTPCNLYQSNMFLQTEEIALCR